MLLSYHDSNNFDHFIICNYIIIEIEQLGFSGVEKMKYNTICKISNINPHFSGEISSGSTFQKHGV